MRAKLPPLVAAVAALLGPIASAEDVLNFGPASGYVTQNTDYSRSASRTGTGPYTYLNAFSDTTALSPGSGYTGPVFYGGYTLTSSTVQGSSLTGLVLDNWSFVGSNDTTRIYANISSGWAGSTLGFASVYLFKQSDFAAPYTTGDFALDGLSVTYRASGAGGAFTPTGRWLVQVGNTYYLSDATIAASYNATSTASISGTALSTAKWAVYDPSTALNFEQSVTYAALDLSSVTAVGIYFEKDAYAGTADGSAALLAISGFTASGTVTSPVPEVATSALMLGFVGLAGATLRRPRRL